MQGTFFACKIGLNLLLNLCKDVFNEPVVSTCLKDSSQIRFYTVHTLGSLLVGRFL